MRVDVRPVSRLRGKEPVDVTAALGPVVEALCASDVDLSRLERGVRLDPVPRPTSARSPTTARCSRRGTAGPRRTATPTTGPRTHEPPAEAALEMAIDLRRCADADLRSVVSRAAGRARAIRRSSTRVPLEPWVAGRQSCIWRFNALYWQALSLWEQATGRDYEQALPGGESDARNTAAVRELILELFKTWDDLDARSALPPELYVAELGVGNGNQARTWLDEFVALSRAHSRDYYRRLHYIMGDYSPHVLGRAMQGRRPPRRSRQRAGRRRHPPGGQPRLPARQGVPRLHLQRLRQPAERRGGPPRRPDLPGRDPRLPAGRRRARIAQQFSATPERVPRARRQAAPAGPRAALRGAAAALRRRRAGGDGFWRDVWAALRLQERYRPLEGLDLYQVSRGPDRRAAAVAAGVRTATSGSTSTTGRSAASPRPCRCCTRSAGCSATTCSSTTSAATIPGSSDRASTTGRS